MARCFLILHGLTGTRPGHWQWWLAERLRADGEDVRFPALPAATRPDPDAWASALHAELAALPDGERTVLCQSLACLLWAREAETIVERHGPVTRLVLVAPPDPAVTLPDAAAFFPVAVDTRDVAASATTARVVCSDDDPYCPAGADAVFAAPLGLPCDVLPGAGHVNDDGGYGAWPALLAWCLDGDSGPIAAR